MKKFIEFEIPKSRFEMYKATNVRYEKQGEEGEIRAIDVYLEAPLPSEDFAMKNPLFNQLAWLLPALKAESGTKGNDFGPGFERGLYWFDGEIKLAVGGEYDLTMMLNGVKHKETIDAAKFRLALHLGDNQTLSLRLRIPVTNPDNELLAAACPEDIGKGRAELQLAPHLTIGRLSEQKPAAKQDSLGLDATDREVDAKAKARGKRAEARA